MSGPIKKRYLSKSRFKIGHECPTKLFYTGKKEYYNQSDDDSFMKNLAEGGYQVGELAKLYYPGGVEPTERNYETAHAITEDLIAQNIPNIYEASIIYKNLFARIDILHRTGKRSFDIIEVKSKSFDPNEADPFWNKTLKKKNMLQLNAKWEDYLFDVAFQTHVARQAFPQFKFTPFLLLADKTANATVDGLNQKFPITRDDQNQVKVGVPGIKDPAELGAKLLVKIEVTEEVDWILNSFQTSAGNIGFEKYVETLATAYESDTRVTPEPSSLCKNCEFFADDAQQKAGFKSGFHECWKERFKTDYATLGLDLVHDLWFFSKTDIVLRSGVFLMRDLPVSAIEERPSETGGLSRSQRQLLQLNKVKAQDGTLYIDQDSLTAEIKSWTYPLHFIDFETTTVAIPFHQGQRPYESIGFQFSHHKMEKDGTFHHEDEFLYLKPGGFPNFDFVRALSKALGNSKGSVFRYSPHENTILRHIKKQLLNSSEPDRDALVEFINSITEEKEDRKDNKPARKGQRAMIDLWDLLKRYYYDPGTHGSNSIKAVFPAILRRSPLLQKKYSKPIYGGSGPIRSKNFKDKIWISKDLKGEIINPYQTLPSVFGSLNIPERMFSGDELKEGGTASAAYSRMQFEQMGDQERQAIASALLRYCELDTLAMVMLVEHWKECLKLS